MAGMVVRELLARYGYKIDRKSEGQVQKSVDTLKRGMQTLAAVFVSGVVAKGLQKLVELGSDANETLNVIGESFEDQADVVLKWANTQAEALGRSEFKLREYAATLGAVLGPTLGSAKATTEMSTALAGLSVDAASFFNAMEVDTLAAFQSGILGEAEPMRKFGVAMSAAALDAFALQQGLSKTTKTMSEAEKIQLRFAFIMDRTAKVQGDAARTAGGYANLVKALTGVIVDATTEIGLGLVPSAERFLTVVLKFARAMRGPFVAAVLTAFRHIGMFMTGIGRGLETILGLLENVTGGWAVMGGVAVAALIAITAPGLVMLALLGLIGVAIFAVVDDLEAMGAGGKSVIGSLIGEFQLLEQQTGSTFGAISDLIANAAQFWAEKLDLTGALDELRGGFAQAMETIDKFAAAFGELGGAVDQSVETLKQLFTALSRAGTFLGEAQFEALKAFVPGLGAIETVASLVPGATTVAPPAAAGAGKQQIITQQMDIQVNAAAGMDERGLARETAAATGRAASDITRRTASQLLVGGAS